MALNIAAKWHPPIALVPVKSGGIYSCPNLDSVPETAGAYVFGRKHGPNTYPLYIGQAGNLRARIKQHLDRVRLMTGIRDAPNGDRFIVYCEVEFKPGQNHRAVLNVLENALIAHALAEDNALLNIQGARFASHTISFTGNRTSESIAPRKMLFRA